MSDKIKLSVVMPSFNEEKAVGVMIEGIKRYSAGFDTEILLVDSSADATAAIAHANGAKVIVQPPRGHGTALRTAIAQASGDIIITSDCDNTYPVEFIPELVKLVATDGYDIISCNRLHKRLGRTMPLTNKLANKAFAFLVRFLYGIQTHDVTTGMFCMKKELAAKVNFRNNYSLPCEIIVRSCLAGFKYKEIDIPYKFRIGEVTLNKWRSGKAYLRCIFNYRFNLGIKPEAM